MNKPYDVCPTCGCNVPTYSSDEGTSSFISIDIQQLKHDINKIGPYYFQYVNRILGLDYYASLDEQAKEIKRLKHLDTCNKAKHKTANNGRTRVVLREPERCGQCNKVFLGLYPIRVCLEHKGLDEI